MRYIMICLALLSSYALLAQNIQKRDIGSFDKIEVTGNISVEMKQSDKETLELKVRNADPSEVVTEVKDKMLIIKMKSNLFDDDVQVKVKLTYKEIREIKSNASAEIKVIDKITGDKIFAEATSGGRILMNVELNAIDLKAYQGAQIEVSGNCKIQESFINTGGVLSASNFNCDEVYIKMNTGGDAEIIANKKIDAQINTGAKLSFFGKPADEKLKTTLGGKITKWDEN